MCEGKLITSSLRAARASRPGPGSAAWFLPVSRASAAAPAACGTVSACLWNVPSLSCHTSPCCLRYTSPGLYCCYWCLLYLPSWYLLLSGVCSRPRTPFPIWCLPGLAVAVLMRTCCLAVRCMHLLLSNIALQWSPSTQLLWTANCQGMPSAVDCELLLHMACCACRCACPCSAAEASVGMCPPCPVHPVGCVSPLRCLLALPL